MKSKAPVTVRITTFFITPFIVKTYRKTVLKMRRSALTSFSCLILMIFAIMVFVVKMSVAAPKVNPFNGEKFNPITPKH